MERNVKCQNFDDYDTCTLSRLGTSQGTIFRAIAWHTWDSARRTVKCAAKIYPRKHILRNGLGISNSSGHFFSKLVSIFSHNLNSCKSLYNDNCHADKTSLTQFTPGQEPMRIIDTLKNRTQTIDTRACAS